VETFVSLSTSNSTLELDLPNAFFTLNSDLSTLPVPPGDSRFGPFSPGLPVSRYFLPVACFNCYEVMEYFPDSKYLARNSNHVKITRVHAETYSMNNYKCSDFLSTFDYKR
jgi:hypothetical protein